MSTSLTLNSAIAAVKNIAKSIFGSLEMTEYANNVFSDSRLLREKLKIFLGMAGKELKKQDIAELERYAAACEQAHSSLPGGRSGFAWKTSLSWIALGTPFRFLAKRGCYGFAALALIVGCITADLVAPAHNPFIAQDAYARFAVAFGQATMQQLEESNSRRRGYTMGDVAEDPVVSMGAGLGAAIGVLAMPMVINEQAKEFTHRSVKAVVDSLPLFLLVLVLNPVGRVLCCLYGRNVVARRFVRLLNTGDDTVLQQCGLGGVERKQVFARSVAILLLVCGVFFCV